MKKVLFGMLLLLASADLFAASNSSPGLYYGQVPTASQWNVYFSNKLDYHAGAANSVPYWDGSGNFLSALISGDCTSVANVFTCAASSIPANALTGTTLASGVLYSSLTT